MVKKILIVDDEPDIMDVATTRLKYSGYDVIPAVDAEEAIAYLEKDICDLILLDVVLPKMHGDELCKMLKHSDKYENIPVVLFTASAMNVANVAEQAGADDYITKPFDPRELLGKIKRLIG